MNYYSIYIPSKSDHDVNDEPFVFEKKEEALKVLKNHKDARLKIFKNNEDAINYAQTGNEIITSKFNDLKSPINLEKSKFHAPTKQELIQFRKAIEEDKYNVINHLIWTNPRYLVNLADTPTSLKDGPRYNALHVCALHNRAKIASLILETISKADFAGFLHNQDDEKLNQEASNVLLDYYLNMPEKGRSETPLHLAAKYGAADVVEVLTSYSQCKMTPNLENQLPKDIVCSRKDNSPPELKERILRLLEEKFYVPIIRSVDNSIPPMIGEPFAQTSPPQLNNDPRSPELKIQAYAGPIKSKEEAEKFRRRWKTPPRNGTSSPIANSPYISPMKFYSSTPTKSSNNNNTTYPSGDMNYNNNISAKKNLSLNFEDTENCINNATSHHNSDNSSEINTNRKIFYAPPLTPLIKNPKKKDLFFTYRDKMSSPLIFDDSDSYSSGGNWEQSDKDDLISFDSPCHKERHLKLTDTEKGFEIIGRELAKEHNIGWKEYWDFLDTFVDISSLDGLIKLEEYLAKKSGNFKIQNHEKSLQQFNSLDLKMELDLVNIGQDITTPYLCMEKSLQVFAKRMNKTILNNLDSVISIYDAFSNELKRLESLVCSFRDDIRFLNIDFNVIHSRFANLITNFLLCNQNSENDSNSLQKIKKCFNQICESRKKCQMNKSLNNKEQLLCVSEMILDYLEYKDKINQIQLEYINTEQKCSEIWREELKCNCDWNINLNIYDLIRKRRHQRKHLDKIYTSACLSPQEIQNKKNSNPTDNIDGYKINKIEKEDQNNDEDKEDEEIFWSDAGSDDDNDENEKFYTPPESPTHLDLEDYNVFLKGNQPSKRDWDVLKALYDVTITKETYPHIYKWKSAILRYSLEERESFPSPTLITKKEIIKSKETNTKLMNTKQRLFRTPILKEHQFSTNNENLNDSKDSSISSIASMPSISIIGGEFGTTLSANISLLNVSDI